MVLLDVHLDIMDYRENERTIIQKIPAYHRGVFKTQSNIYDGALLRKFN